MPIIEHADVRRMLLRQKAIVEGALALLVRASRYADLAAHGDDRERERAAAARSADAGREELSRRAPSSGVSKTVINQITGAGVLQFSPANTSPDFTTWDDKGLYWRTAPSDVLQGKVLGNYMATCGAQTVGMIVLNDAYGTGLAKNVQAAFEAAGGKVVAQELFNEGDSQFSSQVDKVIAAKPDAIALITFDQAKSIVPLMTGKGVKPTQIFMVDGNMSDYSKDFQPGTLKGAQGTIPGTFAKEDFKKKLLAIDPALKDYSYAGESYDAVNLIALAAEAAKSTKGTDIAKHLKDVSEGGEKCNDFPSCVTLLRNGKDIDYDGQSGPVTFSDAGDPTEAYIGIYQYQDDNTYKPQSRKNSASCKPAPATAPRPPSAPDGGLLPCLRQGGSAGSVRTPAGG